MWVKEWRSETENGKCTYYNTQGLKVAEFNYSSGAISDTLFLAANTYILFGKLTYSSIVYGGMQSDDGSSNVSEMSGPYMNLHMKLIRLNPPPGQKKEEFYFTSDFQGEFIVIFKPGNYGLFQKDLSPNDVTADMFSPQAKSSGSILENRNINSPIIIEKNRKISFCNFEHTSVGYAP